MAAGERTDVVGAKGSERKTLPTPCAFPTPRLRRALSLLPRGLIYTVRTQTPKRNSDRSRLHILEPQQTPSPIRPARRSPPTTQDVTRPLLCSRCMYIPFDPCTFAPIIFIRRSLATLHTLVGAPPRVFVRLQCRVANAAQESHLHNCLASDNPLLPCARLITRSITMPSFPNPHPQCPTSSSPPSTRPFAPPSSPKMARPSPPSLTSSS